MFYGIGCGWEPIGRKSIVTKSQRTLLYEIDGITALAYYERYLGDRPPTAEHPLAVYEGDSDRYYMRVPNTYDIENWNAIQNQVQVQNLSFKSPFDKFNYLNYEL